MENETNKGGVRNAITDIIKMWDLDSSNFFLSLEDKLRQSKASFNSKKLKLHFQAAVRIVTTEPCDITGYRQYEEEGETLESLPMTPVTEFWLSVVNTFGALYEAVFQSVHSRTGKTKHTPDAAQHYI